MANLKYSIPTYSFDEPNENTLRITVSIEGLKKESLMRIRMCIPRFDSGCANGDLEVNFEDHGVKLRFVGQRDMKLKNYYLNIVELPHEVDVTGCKTKVLNNSIQLFLRKAAPNLWMNELMEGLKAVDPELEPPPPYEEKPQSPS